MSYVLMFSMLFGGWLHPVRTHITPHCQNGLPECSWPIRTGGQ